MKKRPVTLIIGYAVIMLMVSATVYAPEPPTLKPPKKDIVLIPPKSFSPPKITILPEKKFSMPTIEPRTDIDYKILCMQTDPSTDYKILTIDRTQKNTVKLPFRLPVMEDNFKPDTFKIPTLKQFKGIQIHGLTVPQLKKK